MSEGRVNPAIALQAGQIPTTASTNALSPFEMMNAVSMIRMRQMETANLQNEVQGRETLGQILHNAPDEESAYQQMLKSPAAAWAPQVLAQYRESQLASREIAGADQRQFTEGTQFWAKGLGMLIQDGYSQNSWDNLKKGAMAGLSPNIAARVGGYIDTIGHSLVDGLPSDPIAAKTMLKMRISGQMAAVGGVSNEALSNIVGTTFRGDGMAGVQAPAAAGGGLTIASGGPTGGPGGVQTPPAGGLIPLTGPAPVSGAAAGPSPENSYSNVVEGGMPMPIPGSLRGRVPSQPYRFDTSGQAHWQPGEQQDMEGQLKIFNDQKATGFDAANSALGQTTAMISDLDNLAKAGGVLTPGAGGEFRKDIATNINTLFTSLGEKPPFSPTAIASAEDLDSRHTILGGAVERSMYGGNREAASVINNAMKAVPGMDGTYLGSRLQLAGIQMTARRAIDERNFERQWMQENRGDLRGADTAFAQQYPTSQYVNAALNSVGVSRDGRMTAAQVGKYHDMGYFSGPEAADIAKRGGYLTPQQ